MRSALIGLVLVGCGSKATPPQTVANKQAPAVAKAEVPTCASAAKLLIKERGFGKIPAANQDKARAAGEAEATAACLDDQWPDAVVQCVASRPSPSSCLGQLDEFQEESYRAHFDDWESNFTKGPGSRFAKDGNAEGGDAYGGVVGGAAGGKDAPQEEWVPCEGNYGELAAYDPKIEPKVTDREYALAVREKAVHLACEMTWTNDDKKCFGAAKDAAAISACRGKLADPAKNSLSNLLVESAQKFQKVVALEKAPGKIDCKAVAAAHYGDEAWHGKLTALSPAERKRVIDESKTKLVTSCTSDKWAASLRACLVAAGSAERDADDCYPEKQRAQGYRWGFPAGGVMFKSGIAECDQLADLVKKIGQCTALEQDLRDELLSSFGTQMGMWLEMPASSKAEVGKQCAETVKIYTEGARDRGCTL